jgi:hypothetical protein
VGFFVQAWPRAQSLGPGLSFAWGFGQTWSLIAVFYELFGPGFCFLVDLGRKFSLNGYFSFLVFSKVLSGNL